MDQRLFFLFSLFYFITCPSPSAAQPPTSPGNLADGVDFLFILDQSGSMSGSSDHPAANDPYDKRNEIIDILVQQNLAPASTQGKIFRIAVIEFGARHPSAPQFGVQETTPKQPFYEIAGPQANESEAAYAQRLKTELAPLRVRPKRGYSDHPRALELALNVLQRFEQQPIAPTAGRMGIAVRPRVVLLFTDGKPYAKEKGHAVHPRRLREAIREAGARFPTQTALLVFGLNSGTDYWNGQGYGALWTEVAEATQALNHNGSAQLLEQSNPIYKQIIPALQKFLPPAVPSFVGDTYDVPPYLKAIRFTVEFPKPGLRLSKVLTVTRPDGKDLNLDKVMSHGIHANFRVEEPQPGIWRFKYSQPKGQDPVSLNPSWEYRDVTRHNPASAIHQTATLPITFKVSGPKGDYVPLKNAPVNATVRVVYHGNNNADVAAEQELSAEWTGRDGLFSTADAFAFDKPGRYEIAFRAEAATAQGNDVLVFFSSNSWVEVSDKQLVQLSWSTPRLLRPNTDGHFDITARLHLSQQGKTLDPENILRDNPSLPLDWSLRHTQAEQPLPAGHQVMQVIDGVLSARIQGKLDQLPREDLINGNLVLNLELAMDGRHFNDKYVPELNGDPPPTHHRIPLGLPAGWLWPGIIMGLVLLALALGCLRYGLLWFAFKYSTKTPILQIRHQNAFKNQPELPLNKKIHDKFMDFKRGTIQVTLPDNVTVWKPYLVVVRQFTLKGVKVKLTYTRPDATHKRKRVSLTLHTHDNGKPDAAPIEGWPENEPHVFALDRA